MSMTDRERKLEKGCMSRVLDIMLNKLHSLITDVCFNTESLSTADLKKATENTRVLCEILEKIDKDE
jgi:hypothetical protein